jgi:alkylated DNA repair dioxygenase AlkB
MAEHWKAREIDLFGNPLEESAGAASYTDIQGLQYIRDFVRPETHDQLLAEINKQPWLNDLKRQVQHYGYRYDYKSRSVDYSMRIGDLPEWALELGRRLVETCLLPELPDQVIVNEYEPGQGIKDHVDCEPCFTDTIASLSLGSKCIMNFTEKATKRLIPILLEPRSLVVMTGPARYEWTHGIPPRKSDEFHGRLFKRSRRVSVTFRKVILTHQQECLTSRSI